MNKECTTINIEQRNSEGILIIGGFIVLIFILVEYITLHRILHSLFIIIPIFFFIIRDFFKKDEYLSEILVYNQHIQLRYKCQNHITKEINIKKGDIRKFHVEIYVPEFYTQTYYANTDISIYLFNEKPIFIRHVTNQTSLVDLFKSNWQTAINLVKEHNKLPNFSYEVHGDCEYAKAQIKHYYDKQCDFGIIEEHKILYNTSTKYGKIKFVFGASVFAFSVIVLFVCIILYIMLLLPHTSNDSEIQAHRTIAETNYHNKQYKQAEEGYTYIIKHSNYTYDDKFYKRGKCRFYLDDFTGALDDFNKHKKIVQKYIDDQNNSEYPDDYPRYNNKDLIKINKWIQKCTQKQNIK